MQLLDNHDGELIPTFENRFLKVIRELENGMHDVVMMPQDANDYHPDTGTMALVTDAAYMVHVSNVSPRGTPLKKKSSFPYIRRGLSKYLVLSNRIFAVINRCCFDQKILPMSATIVHSS